MNALAKRFDLFVFLWWGTKALFLSMPLIQDGRHGSHIGFVSVDYQTNTLTDGSDFLWLIKGGRFLSISSRMTATAAVDGIC
jgi:hypothetical protein